MMEDHLVPITPLIYVRRIGHYATLLGFKTVVALFLVVFAAAFCPFVQTF